MDRPIEQAPTAIAAFVDDFGAPSSEALTDRPPFQVFAWGDYLAAFGGLPPPCAASAAIAAFFANGGETCWCLPTASTAPLDLVAALRTLGPDDPHQPSPLPTLLAIPALAEADAFEARAILPEVLRFCADRGIFWVVDPPASASSIDGLEIWLDQGPPLGESASAGALYFPRLVVADPSGAPAPETIGPSGAVLGVFARTDAARGVWRAPAGVEATLKGATPAFPLNDVESRRLNPRAINAIRTFPSHGSVVWGARTLAGSDAQASEWKYVPVRRLANSIVASIRRDLETWRPYLAPPARPTPLVERLAARIEAFLVDLFRRGAFAGVTSNDSFFVRVSESPTEAAIDSGTDPFDVEIGFAPLRPAEFVRLDIRRIGVLNGHRLDPDP